MQRGSRLLGVGIVILLFSCSPEETNKRVLPILGERDVEYKMVNGEEFADTIYHTIPEFSYLNQDSVMITSKSMKGEIWVSDFFFTHCPTICPPMTSQMKRLNSMLSDLRDEVQFMSFSIDPTKDTPARLREYIKEHEIDATNWQFFTGDEEATHRLGVESFLVHAGTDDSEGSGGFAHGDIFTLVDKEGLVRGIYHGTDPKEVDQLEKDIRKLLEYEYGITESR